MSASECRDPRKRITAFGVGVHQGKICAVLVVDDATALIIGSLGGLSHDQAELLCDGYIDGLRESSDIPGPMIDAFLEDPDAIAALEVPLPLSPADRELFKQGAIGGLRLATAGYWTDVEVPMDASQHSDGHAVLQRPTIH